jgi:hypothetical protein
MAPTGNAGQAAWTGAVLTKRADRLLGPGVAGNAVPARGPVGGRADLLRNHLKQPRRSPAVKSWPWLCGTWSLHRMFSPGRKSSSRIMHPAKTLNGSLPALSGLSILTHKNKKKRKHAEFQPERRVRCHRGPGKQRPAREHAGAAAADLAGDGQVMISRGSAGRIKA